jgi:hypothetical protein
LEKQEHLLGIPIPAGTQWEIVEEAAEVIQAARDELIRQAAQGEVPHNDDTSMRVNICAMCSNIAQRSSALWCMEDGSLWKSPRTYREQCR